MALRRPSRQELERENQELRRRLKEAEQALRAAQQSLTAARMERESRAEELARAEQPVRQFQQDFQALIENSTDAVALLDAQGAILYESPAVRQILGYSVDGVIGEPALNFVHPNDLPYVKEVLSRLISQPGAVASAEFRYQHKDGSWRWIEAVGSNALNTPGVGALVINYRDKTDRRLAEDKLRASEARLQRLIENGSGQISILTVDGILLYESPSARPILDYPDGSLLGHEIWEVVHPDDLAKAKEEFDLLIENPDMIVHDQIRLRRVDGTWRWVEGVATNLLGEPSVHGILLNYHDIADRKQAEERLIQSERDLAEAQKVARIGNWSRDAATGTVHWSNEMYEIFGIEPSIAVDSYAADERCIHPEDLPLIERNTAQALATGEAFQHEFRIILATGELRTIAEVGHAIVDANSKVKGLFGTAQDITERKRAETSLRQSEARYRALYEDSPVSLWEEDFSQVKLALDELRRDGITDFRGHLASHPEFVRACRDRVRMTDVNRATLQLFGARDKSELLSAMSRLVDNEALPDFQEELLNIAEGKKQFNWEGTNRTLDGRQLQVHLRWSVVPGYEESLSKVLVFIEDVTEQKRAEEQSRLQLKRLLTLREIDSAIASSFDERFTLNLLVTRLASSLRVDAADVLLLNPYMNTLNFAAGFGFHGPVPTTEVSISSDYAGEIIRERRVVAEPDLQKPERPFSRQALAAREGFKSYFGVPLIAKGEVKGVLEVFHRSRLTPDSEWLDFLETFGGQAAIAIDNAQLFEGLQRSNFELGIAYDSTIEGWSRALDLRDKETEGHTQRVTELTVALARQLGFSDAELLHVRRGALLHDIGKMGVPDAILLKPGPLTEEEWVAMKKHPTFAYELLSPIRYLEAAALEIPYCHHERWNGSGYPRGLKGEQIPFSARIFAVVDVWDAVTSDRPYRAAWPKEQAVEYIRSQAGTQFDVRVVESFIKLVFPEREGQSPPENFGHI